MIKTRKTISLKITAIVLAILMVLSICASIFYEVFAQVNNTILEIQTHGDNVISIDETDPNKLIYKIGDTTVGTVKVKKSENYLTPVIQAGKVKVALPHYANEPYTVTVEVTKENGYNTQPSYFYKGESDAFPGDYILNLEITEDDVHMLDFCFEIDNGGNHGGNDNPGIQIYPIVAYFEGKETGIVTNLDNNIELPEDWTNGKVEFYAKTCKVAGKLTPYYDEMECDENSIEEIRLDIEGIANGEQINRSVYVEGEKGNEVGVITSDFADYGKVTFHLVNQSGINQAVSINSKELIFVKAAAQLGMSYSFGSIAIDNALLTNKQTGNVSIFFGNTETTLIVSGPNISKITKVVGGTGVKYNDDGTATVKLPSLSTETTTKFDLTIELKDGKTITRTVNVVRTAIELQFNTSDGNATLEAGYIFNKAYLYNNKDHDDKVFDAYLQVILYKDGVVAGYKQIKIDDEEAINSLVENESGSMELHSDKHINLYGKELKDTIEGVNSASVFLTNGPVKFDSDTLPSVEFGIGSGITIEFGGER